MKGDVIGKPITIALYASERSAIRAGAARAGVPEGAYVRAAALQFERQFERLRDALALLTQTSGELCADCGWRFKIPGVGCYKCNRTVEDAEGSTIVEVIIER